MRLRSHRRNLVVWSPSVPAGNFGAPRLARPRRIRWWVRAGALLTVIGAARLVRTVRTHWRPVLAATGALLTVVGIVLPSGMTLVPGMLVLLFALLDQLLPARCPTVIRDTGGIHDDHAAQLR